MSPWIDEKVGPFSSNKTLMAITHPTKKSTAPTPLTEHMTKHVDMGRSRAPPVTRYAHGAVSMIDSAWQDVQRRTKQHTFH